MKTNTTYIKDFNLLLIAMVVIFLAAACNGKKGDEDTGTDADVDLIGDLDVTGDDATVGDTEDDTATDVPVEGGDPVTDTPVEFDIDGVTGCTPEMCNDFCESIDRAPGECVDDACWCRGTTDGSLDPDVPYDIEVVVDCDENSDCNDYNVCTLDVCVPATHECEYYPLDGLSCDDGLFCNGIEVCDGASCTPGIEPCHTEEPICQIAMCNEAIDACEFESAPDGTSCDDGQFCNGPDVCTDGFCQRPGPFPCPIASEDPCLYPLCNEVDDRCDEVPKPDGMACYDEFACNGLETCVDGVCTSGDPLCDDGDPCTDDICHEGPDPTCEHIPIC